MELVDREGSLHVGSVRLTELVERLGTPLALYAGDAIVERFYRFVEAFSSLRAMICFATDACPNPHIMRRLVKRGAALRIRSAIDLERAWLCGAPLGRVIYSGLGKGDMDIRAALDGLYSPLFQAGRLVEGKPPYYRGPVGSFSIESSAELDRIARIAGGIRIACRALVHVCFDCCRQHAFGMSPDEAEALFGRSNADQRVRLVGLRAQSPGSSVEAVVAGVERLTQLAQRIAAKGHAIESLDIGGGFACDVQDPAAASPEAYAKAIEPLLLPWVEQGVKIIAEPGWSIVGAGSLLIGRVLAARTCDQGVLAACDAMPSAPMDDAPLVARRLIADNAAPTPVRLSHADRPDRQRDLMLACRTDDLIAFPGGGAYARCDQPGVTEVLLEGSRVLVIRPRATVIDAIEPELESHEVLL